MLQLRPVCEHCATSLPPASTEAMICSFECTFCRSCVSLLENVCPNCGGGFVPRPVRPRHNLKQGNFLERYPAVTEVRHRPVDIEAHVAFARGLKDVPPQDR